MSFRLTLRLKKPLQPLQAMIPKMSGKSEFIHLVIHSVKSVYDQIFHYLVRSYEIIMLRFLRSVNE